MKLFRVERRISNIIGVKISPSVLEVADASCSNLLRAIEKFPQHPLRCFFVSNHERVTRSYCDSTLRKLFARTERFSSSFIKYAG